MNVSLVFRDNPDEGIFAELMHVASSHEKALEWCKLRFDLSVKAGIAQIYAFPAELVWKEGRADIGRRGSLFIMEREVDGIDWQNDEQLQL